MNSSQDVAVAHPVMRSFLKGLRLVPGARRWLCVVVILGLASSLASLLPPLVLANIIDLSAKHASTSTGIAEAVLWSILLMSGASVLADSVRILYGYLCFKLTIIIQSQMRRGIVNNLLGESDTHGRSDKVYAINSDVSAASGLYLGPLTTVVADAVDTLLITIIIAAIDPLLALIVIVPLGPIYIIAKSAARKSQAYAVSVRNEEKRLSGAIDRISLNRNVIRIFGGRRAEFDSCKSMIARIEDYSNRQSRVLVNLMTSVGVLRIGATCGALGLSAWLAVGGKIRVGIIAALMSYLSRYYSPAVNIAKSYQAIQRSSISVGELSELVQPEPRWEPRGSALPVSTPQLLLSGVTAALPTGLLRVPDVRLEGSGLVIVSGPSGSGKTSLMEALSGLRSDIALSGRVQVCGDNIEDVSNDEWFSRWSYASQGNSISGSSVLATVVYPDPPPARGTKTWSRVESLLDDLGVRHLIERVIDEDGSGISGGEARRVVLARSLWKNRPILLLDEVTSGLDLESKKIVEDFIIKKSEEFIVIASSHNFSQDVMERADFLINL